jgi:hypothetical protein
VGETEAGDLAGEGSGFSVDDLHDGAMRSWLDCGSMVR